MFPQLSHVQNSGFDGSGLHCGVNNDFDTKLNNIKTKTLPKKINESKLYRFNAYLFYKKYFLRRYFNYHKKKFESFDSFKKWVLKKIKL